MREPTQEELDSIFSILVLAENSSIWRTSGDKAFEEWRDKMYAHIQTTRDYLRDNGLVSPLWPKGEKE